LAAAHRSRFVNSCAHSIPNKFRPRPGAGALALILLIALGANACGRRGALEPPPDPSAVAKPDDPDHPRIHAKAPPILPPKDPFVLDPLL
jgi:predicted small lipoprotein YifL